MPSGSSPSCLPSTAKRPALKQRGGQPRLRLRKANPVTFSPLVTVTSIANFRSTAELWTVMDEASSCDACGRETPKDLLRPEGFPSAPRFDSSRFVCQRCVAGRLYATVGAHFIRVVAEGHDAAAGRGSRSQGRVRELRRLLRELYAVAPVGGVCELTTLLGGKEQVGTADPSPDSALEEVRGRVLKKAYYQVNGFFGVGGRGQCGAKPRACAEPERGHAEAKPRQCKRAQQPPVRRLRIRMKDKCRPVPGGGSNRS